MDVSPELLEELRQLDRLVFEMHVSRYGDFIEPLLGQTKKWQTSILRRVLEQLMADEKTCQKMLQSISEMREKYSLPTQSEYQAEMAEVEKYKLFYRELEIPSNFPTNS